MKKILTFFVVCLCLILVLSACKKEVKPPQDEQKTPLVFSSLTAESDTIITGTSTQITAHATGSSITYQWTATAGTLLGSGNQVVFTTPPCIPGVNTITCTVKDVYNNTASKSIDITAI